MVLMGGTNPLSSVAPIAGKRVQLFSSSSGNAIAWPLSLAPSLARILLINCDNDNQPPATTHHVVSNRKSYPSAPTLPPCKHPRSLPQKNKKHSTTNRTTLAFAWDLLSNSLTPSLPDPPSSLTNNNKTPKIDNNSKKKKTQRTHVVAAQSRLPSHVQ